MSNEVAAEETAELILEEKPIPGYVRVDLLPQEIIEKAAIRKARNLAVILLVVAVFIIVIWRLFLQLQIQSAEDELLRVEATGAQLQAEIAQYNEIPPVFAAADQGQQALTLAMGREVRWSFLLNQLSFSTPSGVDLESISGSVQLEGATETSPGDVFPLQPSEGTMTFSGTADSYSQVASWLDSLQGLKDYTYPFLASASGGEAASTTSPPPAAESESDSAAEDADGETDGDGATTVEPVPEPDPGFSWDSTANLSPNALSGRYSSALPQQNGSTPPAPTVPAPTNPQPDSGGDSVEGELQ